MELKLKVVMWEGRPWAVLRVFKEFGLGKERSGVPRDKYGYTLIVKNGDEERIIPEGDGQFTQEWMDQFVTWVPFTFICHQVN